MHIATLSSKRQITIPKRFLDELRLKPKSKFILELEKGENRLSLKPIKKSIAEELAGSLTKFVDPSKLGVPFSKIREEAQRLAAEELVKKWQKK